MTDAELDAIEARANVANGYVTMRTGAVGQVYLDVAALVAEVRELQRVFDEVDDHRVEFFNDLEKERAEHAKTSEELLNVEAELRAARERLKAVEWLTSTWRARWRITTKRFAMAATTTMQTSLLGDCADELEAALRGGK